MKKRLTFITFLMLFSATVFGQSSHWGTPIYSDRSMTIYGKIYLNGVLQNRDDIEIGAFCGDELRGYANPVASDGDYIFVLDIAGKKNNEAIEFKLYHPEFTQTDVELIDDLDLEYIVRFRSNDLISMDVNFIPSFWDKYEIVPVMEDADQSMTVYAHINIDGEFQNRADLEIAAFCGEELRAISRPSYNKNTNTYIAELYIYGDEFNEEEITFNLYDHSGDVLSQSMPLSTDYSVPFVDGQTIGIPPIYLNFIYRSVAKIGDNYYTSLADAVEAAEEGATITLLRDAEGAGVVINKDVTIDFGNFTYTLTTPAVGSTGTETNGFQILKVMGDDDKANKVTLKNGTLNVAEANAESFAILIQNYADLTLNGMTLNGENLECGTTSYVLSNNSGEVSIHNSTINANGNEGETHFAFDACKFANYSIPVVNVFGDVTVNGLVELTGGHILCDPNVAINVVAKKTFKAGGKWGTISTPVAGGAAIPEISGDDKHDLYKYDEPSAMWQYYQGNNLFTKFEVGTGYIYAGYLVNDDDVTVEMSGTLNTQEVSFNLTYTDEADALAGFNLIGNPFSSNISIDNFKVEGYELGNAFYKVDENGALNANLGGTIAAMESAMIKLTRVESKTRATAKVTIYPSLPGASKRNIADEASLAINVNNAEYSDVAFVSFSEGLGLTKINHFNEEVPMIYIQADGEDLAIAKMSQDVTEIPVSFKAATMGEYTIGVEVQNCEYAMMTLVDRFSGVETNLLLEDYTFMATANDNAERFIIKLAMSNANESGDENFAFINNGELIIYNIEGQGMLSIYDITGRPVAEYNVATSANISTDDFAAGLYIIRMADENGVKTQKIVIE